MRTFIAAMIGMFALGAAEAAAESPAATDFSSLCIDTRADAAVAFAAADARGWTRDTIDAALFAQITGSSEGREINRGTTAFRALSAGQSNATRRTCVLVSQEPFEVVSAEVARLIPVEAGQRTERQITWRYISVDGDFQSFDRMSSDDAVRAGQSGNPHIEVIALSIQGGTILAYSEIDYGSRAQ